MIGTSSKKKIQPNGAWTEIAPTGELLFCYKGRKNREKFVEKLSLKDIAEFLNNHVKQINLEKS